jgi:anti-sigma factor RsiW
MDSILNQLENDQAILLMYLADELPPADRTEVDRRLARDAALCAQLEELRACHKVVTQSLGELDKAQPLPGSAASAERKLASEIAQWQTERVRRAGDAAPVARQQRISIWAWLVPVGVAAALFIGFVAWWDVQLDHRGTGVSAVAVREESTPLDPDGTGDAQDGVSDSTVVVSVATADDLLDASRLSMAETDMDAVVMLRAFTE